MDNSYVIKQKKSDFAAATVYDYKRLCFERPGMLSCSMEAEEEELIFHYDISGKYEFQLIQKENMIRKLGILANVYRLRTLCEEYSFSLNPGNLYYDICGNVFILRRDIAVEQAGDTAFVQEYKALAGAVLQPKFSYADYLGGNERMLKKNETLYKMKDCENAEEVYEVLADRLRQFIETEREQKTSVDKRKYRLIHIYAVCTSVILLLLGSGLYYTYYVERPLLQASIQSGYSYIDTDYVGIIDALREVSIEKMEKHDKYILAMSYIKSENLTVEQKENILASLSVKEDEKLLNYWIAIGRLNTQEAVNIAMQRSDDELLLYAYLKEKDMLEQDKEMDGGEKQKRLEELKSQIEELTAKYETTEGK